jgi:transposase
MPRIAPAVALDSATRSTLKGWIQASSTPQAQVLRSRIVLQAAAGLSNQQIAVALQIPEVTVGKWRRSFAALGLDGLRDAPRSGRPPKHDAGVWQKVQTLACQQPESQGRWTVRTLARKLGLPPSTVHTILQASKLPLHRVRTFTFSPDPDFEAKLLDIVGLYSSPFTWTKGPEQLQHIIETTKKYQATHPRKPRRRRARRKKAGSIKN